MNALLTAILPLVGVLVGATIQYAAGRRLEAQKHLAFQRAQAYGDFFKSVAALAQGQSESMNALAADAKTRICIYGSASAVEKLAEFQHAGATVDSSNGKDAVVALIKAMRDDLLGPGSSLSDHAVQEILFFTSID